MNLLHFPIFGITAAILYFSGAILAFFTKHNDLFKKLVHATLLAAILVLAIFITMVWLHVQRPPFRTLGETRLWYSLFSMAIGYFVYIRWKFPWMPLLGFLFVALFLSINLSHPETWEKELMPALQSYWFVPHVSVYLFAYSLFGIAWVMALRGLLVKRKNAEIQAIDSIVHIAFTFLTIGLSMGAFWANEAWGHYWTWDPKEIWALLTWMVYLIYIHFRYRAPSKIKAHLWVLVFSFSFLMLCWFGLKYLPTANDSVHVYTN